MTALTKYQRLEATGLWRASPEDQRREVVISIGDATLTISNMKDQALTHWSLAAVERANPGEEPAIYSPDGDPGETLELDASEAEMIDAIERLRQAIDRARPHPGRLRILSIAASAVAVIAILLVWLPGAMRRHTVSVVPEIKRQEIGRALLGRIERVAGKGCTTPETSQVLSNLARRTGARRLVVLRTGVKTSLSLPGGIILLNKSLVEDFEDPSVVAGFILAERARTNALDPLEELLSAGGPTASFRLLTTGEVIAPILDRYAETILVAPRPDIPNEAVLAAFAEVGISSTAYAYAIDVTGETVLGLIEADPLAGKIAEPVLRDRDWVMLQTICGS